MLKLTRPCSSPQIQVSLTAASGYFQQSRLTRSAYPTLLLRNATSHADRHGHGCPSAPAMQHSRGADHGRVNR